MTKTLIVTTEQGHGDAIQFIRYAGVIKKRYPSCKIYFAIQESMHRLLRGVVGLDGCLPDHLTPEFAAACPPFDYHAPLLHLPDICGTTLETIPGECPYILPQPDWIHLPLDADMTVGVMPDREGRAVESSPASGPSRTRRIGLCWAGSPLHGKDKWRSMRPAQFQRFIDAAPGAQFYSLQCGPRAAEVGFLRGCEDLAQFITDWTQTATAILQMQLVITVDTAIAHLAGALGVPCWILLPSSPDWRWFLQREDSPYYPKARLFRQETRDDWEPVIEAVCKALQ